MNGIGDFASVLRVLKSYVVNVAVSFAATWLCGEAIFSNGSINTIETST
jgi:hypothetical protein